MAEMDLYKEWLGIPEGPRPPDHYELLRCVRFTDEAEKIRAHYKKLNAHVRKYATGKFSVQSQELLNEMAKAMLCLTDVERKRDYDESLGREFTAEKDTFGRIPLLDVLVKQQAITREQKKEAEEYADLRGLSHRDAVVQMKLVELVPATKALAQQLGYSYVDLEDLLPDDAVLDAVPRQLVKKHSCLPLFEDDGQILVACSDQPEHEVEEEISLRFGMPMRPVIATPRSINQALAKYYAPGARDETRATRTKVATTIAGGEAATKKKDKPKAKKAGAPAASGARFADLTPEEQKDRKLKGIMAINFSAVIPLLPYLLSNLSSRVQMIMVDYQWIRWIPALALITVPATFSWVWFKYWK
jgi:hypothetical protein